MSAILNAIGSFAKQIADDFIAHGLYDWVFPRKGDGPGRTVNPEAVRVISPHFAKHKRDEARFQILLDQLSNSRRKALEVGFLSQIGANQLAEFIISVAEVSHVSDRSDDVGEQQATMAAVHFLERLADEDDLDVMKQMAVDRRFMRANEEQYPIVILQNTLGIKFENLPQLREWLARNGGQLKRLLGSAWTSFHHAVTRALSLAATTTVAVAAAVGAELNNAAGEAADQLETFNTNTDDLRNRLSRRGTWFSRS